MKTCTGTFDILLKLQSPFVGFPNLCLENVLNKSEKFSACCYLFSLQNSTGYRQKDFHLFVEVVFFRKTKTKNYNQKKKNY